MHTTPRLCRLPANARIHAPWERRPLQPRVGRLLRAPEPTDRDHPREGDQRRTATAVADIARPRRQRPRDVPGALRRLRVRGGPGPRAHLGWFEWETGLRPTA